MSDTKVGRSSIRTPHGLSRFGRRSARGQSHASRARSSVVVGSEPAELTELTALTDLAELTHLIEPAVLTDSLTDTDAVTVDVPAEVVSTAGAHTVDTTDPAAAAPVVQGVASVSTDPAPATRPTTIPALPVAAGLALAAALLAGAPLVLALVVTTVWLLVALRQTSSRLVPGVKAWSGLGAASTAAVATAGCAVGLLDAPRALVTASLAMAVAGSSTAVVLRLLRRIPRRRILVVGGGTGVSAAAARWLGHDRVQVVGALVSQAVPGSPSDADHDVDGLVESLGVPVTHDADDLGDLIDRTGADLVVLCNGTDEATLRHAAWQVESRPVGLVVAGPLDSVSPHRLQVTSFAGATLTHVARSRPTAVGLLAKSALDRLAGLVLLFAVLPVIAVLALWIRLDSPGPVFFRQTRVGHRGRLFTMWKLRTMVTEAELIKSALAGHNEGAGLLFKMQADPRITPAGRILRRLSLDELPQLINVIRGEMSLVGPRPALPAEVARYDRVTRRRLASKPGITGLWQVSGRSDLTWDESVRLDLHYTDNWRIRDDAAILFRTAGAVLYSRGAY